MDSTSSLLDNGYLTHQLNEIDLHALAKDTGFCRRRARKVSPALFLKGLLALGASGYQSLRQRALLLGVLSQQHISKQALFKRSMPAASKFVLAVLGAVLRLPQADASPSALARPVLSSFTRVLIQDSTTIALHERLAHLFPGSGNLRVGNKYASLKVQAIYELLEGKFLGFELSSFRRNDQAASPLILDYCAPGDLIIRDLGYFVLTVLRAIAQKGAFFLSRLRQDCALYALETQQRLELLAILRKEGRFDGIVAAGAKEKLPVRLLALPLPAKIAAERRRKARANRDRRLNPSRATLELLGWEIFITNVESEHLSAQEIGALYGLRWRIETLFKAFKSHFALAQTPCHASKHAVELFIYSKLLFIALFSLHAPLPSGRAPGGELAYPLSLIKLAQAFALLLAPLTLMPTLSQLPPNSGFLSSLLLYHCAYEKRSRAHFAQSLQSLS